MWLEDRNILYIRGSEESISKQKNPSDANGLAISIVLYRCITCITATLRADLGRYDRLPGPTCHNPPYNNSKTPVANGKPKGEISQ